MNGNRLVKRILALFFMMVICTGSVAVFADEAESSGKSESGTESQADITVPEQGAERSYLDLGEALSQETKDALVEKNKTIQDKGEIVVVTVKSLNGADPEKYATALFDKWEVGGKDKGNGLVLVLDIGGDTYASVAGGTFAASFPNGKLDQLLASYLDPDFAAKKYDDGVVKFLDAFIKKMDTAATASGAQSQGTAANSKGGIWDAIWGFIKILLIIVAVIVVLGLAFVVVANVRANKLRKERRRARSRAAAGSAQRSGRASDSSRSGNRRPSSRRSGDRTERRR